MGNAEFGAHIRERMNELGMIQKELAAKIGIPEIRLSRILNGKRKMTINEAFAMANALYMDIDTVAKWYAEDRGEHNA